MFYFIFICIVFIVCCALYLMWKKNMLHWIGAFALHSFKKPNVSGPVHILFCFVDHYEPRWRTDDIEVERARVGRWAKEYPELAIRHVDADGVHPQHSFFYPEEEYREEHLDVLQKICEDGYGEVEIHLHHNDDTSDSFREKLSSFKKILATKHGLLSKDENGEIGFCFIHGNWALDNCDPTGANCGVNDELVILREEGCFSDMTYPSAPHPTQPRTVNKIYMATDDPNSPNSHDTGEQVEVNKKMEGDLLMIQGPLCLNWSVRKFGIIPKIENGDIRKTIPPTEHRADLWIKQWIHVKGRPDWLIVKIHTHGTQDGDMDTLLGEPMDKLHTYLETKYNDGSKYVLHYVSARELTNIIIAAADGKSGNPNNYRNYKYKKNKFS